MAAGSVAAAGHRPTRRPDQLGLCNRGVHSTVYHQHTLSLEPPTSRRQRVLALRTRQYIVAAVAGTADAEAAAARLLRDQDDIGNAIVPCGPICPAHRQPAAFTRRVAVVCLVGWTLLVTADATQLSGTTAGGVYERTARFR